MMDRRLFDDYKFKHEYAMLVGRRLDLLLPEERATWFGWIDAGPNLPQLDETVTGDLDINDTKVARQERLRYWQFTKLYWVRNHLESEQETFYEQMFLDEGWAICYIRFTLG